VLPQSSAANVNAIATRFLIACAPTVSRFVHEHEQRA
jgi:hypothetical protein